MTREQIRQEAEESVNRCTPYHTGSFIQGYIAGAENREEKIADIKANCDLTIEGRDIKIKELELELTVEKDQLQEEINLHLHAEDYIKSLEEDYNKLLDVISNYEVKVADLEKQIEKMKTDVKQEQSYWNSCEMQYRLFQRLLDKWEIKE